MSLPRLLSRPLRSSARGGFTLVELLVVIAIIALLAGVAIGPITGAMQTAKDNAGMQTTHALYIADFQYSIDNNCFADGADAGAIATELVTGGYITDPGIFYIAGGNTSKITTAVTATAPMEAANVSWDFMGSNPSTGSGYNGLSSSDPDQLPLVWSTGNAITIPTGSGGVYGSATVNSGGKNAYGAYGIPVAYKSGKSQFQKANSTGVCPQFIDNSYVPPASANYAVRYGSK